MVFQHPSAVFTIPDGVDVLPAISRTTHLGIGAHADDLEFMALHGILAAYGRDDQWFGGVTCTDGAGSVGSDNTEALIARRRAEQDEAARIGQYAFMAQLGYTSAEAKDPNDTRLADDLVKILQTCRPQIVYTHNPADRHMTHIAVMSRVIQAIRLLPRAQRPHRVLGCEVWRDLDWLPDHAKIALDISANPELAAKLTSAFTSQTDGGKRYDLAVRGRAIANATFLDSHARDAASAVWLAMDLTPLVDDDALTLRQFVARHLDAFKQDVMEKLERFE